MRTPCPPKGSRSLLQEGQVNSTRVLPQHTATIPPPFSLPRTWRLAAGLQCAEVKAHGYTWVTDGPHSARELKLSQPTGQCDQQVLLVVNASSQTLLGMMHFKSLLRTSLWSNKPLRYERYLNWLKWETSSRPTKKVEQFKDNNDYFFLLLQQGRRPLEYFLLWWCWSGNFRMEHRLLAGFTEDPRLGLQSFKMPEVSQFSCVASG